MSSARLNIAAAVLLLSAAPAVAQTAAPVIGGVVSSPQVIVVNQPGLVETAAASCAGGAAIGYLMVLAVGAPAPGTTAALFCGLSVAATTASAVTAWTWHKVFD
jgi:hypothetical protein